MKKLVFFLVLMVCVFSGCTLAEGIVTGEKINQIEEYLLENMNKFNVPGMSVVIVEGDKIVFEKGYGVQKSGSDLRVDENTNFCLASVSKSFTALAILQLRDKGLLNLDDPVIKYIPWFRSRDKNNSDLITIRHLMQHTSGIPTTAYGLEIENGREEDLEEQIKKLAQINLVSRPGTGFNYSNFNYWTQALLIEKITGEKFADYMDKYVFKPMGMERTGYYRYIKDLGNLSSGYRVEFGKPKFLDYRVPDVTNAAGGLYSNANDMGNYLITILNSGAYGENNIIREDSLKEMYVEGFRLRNNIEYGFGWFSQIVSGHVVADHGGDNPNFTAHICIFPNDGIGYALLSNSQHPVTHYLSGRIGRILLGGEVRPITKTPAENRNKLAKLAIVLTLMFVTVILIWLVFVLKGLKTNKYVFSLKIHPLRLLIQVILVPLIGFFVLYNVSLLPEKIIGSYRIALLYQPDLVNSAMLCGIVFVFFTIFVAIMGFVTKPAQNIIDSDNIL